MQDEANNDIMEEASEEESEEAPKKREEKAEEINASEGVKDLSPEERKLFSQFLHPRSMRTQIANALENISLASYVGNVLITTDHEETGFNDEAYEDAMREWEDECDRVYAELEFDVWSNFYVIVDGTEIEDGEEILAYLDRQVAQVDRTNGHGVRIA